MSISKSTLTISASDDVKHSQSRNYIQQSAQGTLTAGHSRKQQWTVTLNQSNFAFHLNTVADTLFVTHRRLQIIHAKYKTYMLDSLTAVRVRDNKFLQTIGHAEVKKKKERND